MNAKNVWGIILIILGLLFIFGGINEFQAISFLENEVSLLNKTAISFFGKSNSHLFGMDDSKELLRNEKIKCALSVLLGIAGAFFGTLMLKNDTVKSLKTGQSVSAYDDDGCWNLGINDKFKMESRKDGSENDNTKWMHPDIREKQEKPSFKL